jgi:hypothetical protein
MGIVHFVNGLFYLLKQVAGAWCGVALVEALVHVPNVETAAIDLPGYGHLCCCSAQVMPPVIKRQFETFLWQSPTVFANSSDGTFVAALFVTVCANCWSQKTRRPASIVKVPAFYFLVSGSYGFTGM